MDVFGKALLDYQHGIYSADIITHMKMHGYDDEIIDHIALPYLFRSKNEMPILEQKALDLCEGSILDIGCGAGSHSLYLQEKGQDVTALDHSKGAIQTCTERGLHKTIHANVFDFTTQKFDTLLLLMNGIGIAENLKRLKPALRHLKRLLNHDGQILLDSSDIRYMYDENDITFFSSQQYYGEVQFKMNYQQQESEVFEWLYVDFKTLKKVANSVNLECELVSTGQHNDYLARLTKSKH